MSYVKVTKQNLLDICNKAEKNLIAYRKEEREKSINECMKPSFFGLLRGYSRKMAEEMVDRPIHWDNYYSRWQMYGWGTESAIKSARRLCSITNDDMIYLSNEELSYLVD